jgi:hypothetical protein
MSISIPNAGQQNLTALVRGLGNTDGAAEIRTRDTKKGDTKTGTELYVKENASSIFGLSKRSVDSQKAARADIKDALYKEFPKAVADRVFKNMNDFFGATSGKVTVADAVEVLRQANAGASDGIAVVGRRVGRQENEFERQEDDRLIDDAQATSEFAAVHSARVDARATEAENRANLFDTQNHPQLAGLFSAFLNKEHSHENFDFIQAVKDYKAIPADANGVTDKIDAAKALVNKFRVGGQVEVNLPAGLRLKPIVDAQYNGLSAAQQNNLFDESANNIVHLATHDSASRFVKTDEFRDYINNG